MYKRQVRLLANTSAATAHLPGSLARFLAAHPGYSLDMEAVSYTHLTPADERSSVDLGGRRIIKKKHMSVTRIAAHESTHL